MNCAQVVSTRARGLRTSRASFATEIAIGAVLLAAAGAHGCASARPPDPLAPSFATQELTRAKQLAPDLYGRAEQARREAAAARQPALRDHARARAELWLEATLTEARRVQAQRAATVAETRVAVAEAARVAAQREREQLDHALALAEAERASKAVALRMFQGGGLASATKAGDNSALAEAAAFAVDRATALLAAARALGLDGARAASLDARFAPIAARPIGLIRVRESLALLAACEHALGQARLSDPTPSAGELASLRADALERGLTLELTAEAAVLTLDARTFAAGRAGPTAQGTQALDQLASLLRLHARGAVLVQSGPATLDAGRARTVASRLRRERPELRVALEPSLAAGSVRLLLPDYRVAHDPGSAPTPTP